MIGDLLKQLFVGLWRYICYRARRLFRLRQSQSVPPQGVAAQATYGADSVGTVAVPEDPILSDAYTSSIRMTTSRRDLESVDLGGNTIFELWKQQKPPRAHKWTRYFEAYQAILEPLREQPLRILEIGVYQGASLRLWRRYFANPLTVLVGVDIDPTCTQFDSPRENVHVRIGSQADAAFLSTVARDFGPFDIIIDDGSHFCSHMFASFNYLFAGALRDSGIYLAEDLHANYWMPYRDRQLSFLDLCKELMEYMHVHYTRTTLGPWLQESESEWAGFTLDVPLISTMIREIRVFDSIVAIYKTRRDFLPRVLNPTAD